MVTEHPHGLTPTRNLRLVALLTAALVGLLLSGCGSKCPWSCGLPTDEDQDGVVCQEDCNDDDPEQHPASANGTSAVIEVCDGLDNDCNGTVDDVSPHTTWYRDHDGDQYGVQADAAEAPCQPEGYVIRSGDCNDDDLSVHPDQGESCNGLDDNCNGELPREEVEEQRLYADTDGDGYGDPAVTQTSLACEPTPEGFVPNNVDCDDTKATLHPEQKETCNGIDDDCDGEVPSQEEVQTAYADNDGDGYGDPAVTQSPLACAPLPEGTVSNNLDCDDTEATLHPDQEETCNGIDDDCDGEVPSQEEVQTAYADDDGDGYGDPAVTESSLACAPTPEGFVSNNADCDDTEATLHPDQEEICNGFDDDCDGEVPSQEEVQTAYADDDGDGYGDPAVTESSLACAPLPEGTVSNDADCDDTEATLHPDQEEICNGIDDDCDGATDEEVKITFYLDRDGDGFGDSIASTQACSRPAGYASQDADCNDSSRVVYPEALELPGTDEDRNCDGNTRNYLKSVAGGFLGDGDLVSNGYIDEIRAMTVSSDGSLYLATIPSNRIRRIDASQRLSTVAGSGVQGTPLDGATATASNLSLTLDSPSRHTGLDVFESGQGVSLFFSDTAGLWRVSPDGTLTRMGESLYLPGNYHTYGALEVVNLGNSALMFVLERGDETGIPTLLPIRGAESSAPVPLPSITLPSNGWSLESSFQDNSLILWVGPTEGSSLQRVQIGAHYEGTPELISIKEQNLTDRSMGLIEALAVLEDSLEQESTLYLSERQDDATHYLVKCILPWDETSCVVEAVTALDDLEALGIVLSPDPTFEVILSSSAGILYGYSSEATPALEVYLRARSQDDLNVKGAEGTETALQKPYGLALLEAGGARSLVVSEIEGHAIRQYDLSSGSSQTTLNASISGACGIDGSLTLMRGLSSVVYNGSPIIYAANQTSSYNGTIFELRLGVNGFTCRAAITTQSPPPSYAGSVPALEPTGVFVWLNEEGVPTFLFADQYQHCIQQATYHVEADTYTVSPFAATCGSTTGAPQAGNLEQLQLTVPWDIAASLVPAQLGYRLNRVFISSDCRLVQIDQSNVGHEVSILAQVPCTSHAGPWIEYAQEQQTGEAKDLLYVASDCGFVQRGELSGSSITLETLAGVDPSVPDYRCQQSPYFGASTNGPADESLLSAQGDLVLDPQTGILYLADQGSGVIQQLQTWEW